MELKLNYQNLTRAAVDLQNEINALKMSKKNISEQHQVCKKGNTDLFEENKNQEELITEYKKIVGVATAELRENELKIQNLTESNAQLEMARIAIELKEKSHRCENCLAATPTTSTTIGAELAISERTLQIPGDGPGDDRERRRVPEDFGACVKNLGKFLCMDKWLLLEDGRRSGLAQYV
ncbi:hypothetical protein B566_EDAN011259 [Ephemera danica]|nr:hypothetical protein B566_EDAN011259 [Ephemera danica]